MFYKKTLLQIEKTNKLQKNTYLNDFWLAALIVIDVQVVFFVVLTYPSKNHKLLFEKYRKIYSQQVLYPKPL